MLLQSALVLALATVRAQHGDNSLGSDIELFMPTNLVPKPLPIAISNTDFNGNVLSIDSVSYILNGRRLYPIRESILLPSWLTTLSTLAALEGEIHPARVPASQWRNELLKMKAGGLNYVAGCTQTD